MNQATESTKQSTALVTVEGFNEKYPEDKYNQLLPSKTIVESVQKFSRIAVEIVQINADPQQQEVFSLGKTKIVVNGLEQWVDKLSPTKTALDKLWYAMGIESVPEKSGRVDDRRDRDYFEYMVVARITKPDGSKMEVSATKAIDVRTYIEEMFESLTQTHEAGNLGEWRKPSSGKGAKTYHKFNDAEAIKHIAKKTRSREIEMRKHGLQLAETGAKNRLVRQITNLKPWYTAEELNNPFVVARIDRDVEELAGDPKTRAEMFREGSHAADLAYPADAVHVTPLPNIEDADFTEEADAEPKQDESVRPTAADLRVEFEEQCQEMDTTARFRQMESLIESRQIKDSSTDKLLVIEFAKWEKMSDDKQVKNLMWGYDKPKPEGLPYS